MIWSIGNDRAEHDSRPASDASDEIRDSILSACSKSLSDAGKPRYVDDLTYHSISLSFLLEVVPDARIVHCTRDAQDVIPEIIYSWRRKSSIVAVTKHRSKNFVWSALPRLGWRFAKRYLSERTSRGPSTWGPRIPGLAEFSRANGPVLAGAFQWKRMVEIFQRDLAILAPERVLTVRYEDMLNNLDQQCERIATFCEMEDPGSLVEAARAFVNPKHAGPWYQITQPEWDAIRSMVDETNQLEGYPPLPDEVPTQPIRHRGGRSD
jgi:hypothetical protein